MYCDGLVRLGPIMLGSLLLPSCSRSDLATSLRGAGPTRKAAAYQAARGLSALRLCRTDGWINETHAFAGYGTGEA